MKKYNVWLILTHLCRHWPFRAISDAMYLKIYFRAYIGKRLDLKNPKTYNEKLQWLKLYDRNPLYTDLSDKYKVRKYIEDKIGNEYLIPLLGVWDKFDDIDFNCLPDKFVLKCNHDSASVVICKDKASLDIKKARKKLEKARKTQYFWKSREYNYKNIERKIIAEKYMQDDKKDDLTDFKFFCFNGKPEFIQVDTGRFSNHIRNFYDLDWNFIDFKNGKKNDINNQSEKPEKLDKMIELAKVLSEGLVHVRVDFYYTNGNIYFGEMTFHHGGGSMKYDPSEYDLKFGNLINLDLVK